MIIDRPPLMFALLRSGPQWRGGCLWLTLGTTTEPETMRRPRPFGFDFDVRFRPFSVMTMLRIGPVQISASPRHCYIGDRELRRVRYLWSRFR